MGLWYPKDSGFELKAFADADYAGCHDTRRSTSGSAQFLGHRLDAVLKSSGCTSQLRDYDLRSQNADAQIRRIFLDGYGVLDVRTVIFKFLRLSSRMHNLEKERPSVTEKPTNGSLCLEVNFEFDTVVKEECSKYVTLDKKLIQSIPFYFSDDDHYVDKITITSKVYNMEEARLSVTEKPTNGSLCIEVDFENDDDDMMIDAPSVRDLHQLAKITWKRHDSALLRISQMDHYVLKWPWKTPIMIR
ncbi:hypothetical protein Tco_0912232 [Tanacetum coccineum]